MLYLRIPDDMRNDAKANGVKWDGNKFSWFIKNRSDYLKNGKLLSHVGNFIFKDYIDLIGSHYKCFWCGEMTRVICFGSSNFMYEFGYQNWKCIDDTYVIVPSIISIPHELKRYILSEFNYRPETKKQMIEYRNYCDHCDQVQSKELLFNRITSPFLNDINNYGRDYYYERFSLEEDVIVTASDLILRDIL